jgi:hypothetical protein
MLLAWACVASGLADAAPALRWRDEVPSMRWAYETKETEKEAIIEVRDLAIALTEAEGGALISAGGPVAWPVGGKPRLPLVVLLVEVPAGEHCALTWSASSLDEKTVPALAPVWSPVVRAVRAGAYGAGLAPLRDDTIYLQDRYWPEPIVRTDEATGAGHRYLRIEISPLQYNPVRGLLRTHRGLRVVLTRGEGAGP